jgi:hypothetical protein
VTTRYSPRSPACSTSPAGPRGITDVDGNRVTAFANNTTFAGPGMQLADLELRHRRRVRCEDRFRLAKDTGLRNLPLHDFDQNRILSRSKIGSGG